MMIPGDHHGNGWLVVSERVQQTYGPKHLTWAGFENAASNVRLVDG
jgi:hypothetical protein